MTEFDHSRASPETVRELFHAVSEYIDRITLKGGLGCDNYRLRVAEQAYRSECRLPQRTREQIDAEIAKLTRECVDDEWAGDDDYAKWEAITKLCSEPARPSNSYGPHDEPSADPTVDRALETRSR